MLYIANKRLAYKKGLIFTGRYFVLNRHAITSVSCKEFSELACSQTGFINSLTSCTFVLDNVFYSVIPDCPLPVSK